MLVLPAAEGFVLGASLIVAIGAQNAFVLRCGLAGLHVGMVVVFCAVTDALLITVGVAGLGTVVADRPLLLDLVGIGGSAFLYAYAARAFHGALWPKALHADGEVHRSRAATIRTAAALTFLNPHVYLDTVVLLGGIAGRYPAWERVAFGIGAIVASSAWFVSLGFGARRLAPLFARPVAWRYLDGFIGMVMFSLATALLVGTLGGAVR